MSSHEQQHILIIGAGICGLAIAQGLQKAGIPFDIFEAEEEHAFRPREWTMALHWSLPMLESLLPEDLVAALRTEAVVDPSLDYTVYPNNVIPVIDGSSGEVIREIPNEGIRVSRRKLRALVGKGVGVKFGHKLSDITFDDDGRHVTASFANGSTFTGSMLVGADGARSVVRQHMFGPEAATGIPMDLVYINVSFKYSDAEKAVFVRSANPVTSMAVHPNCNAMISMQDVLDPAKPENWMFQLIMMWKGTERGKEEMKDRAKGLCEPFQSAFLWMPDEIETLHNELGYWLPPMKWENRNGHVTLAGDAAHSMPPHRGQGLNNAINDAYNFVDAAKRVAAGEQRAGVVGGYCDEVAQRGGKEVKLSKETAELMLDHDGFRKSALMTKGLGKA